MQHWAAQSIYYHLVIDRFATGKCQFEVSKHSNYEQRLQDWMGGNLQALTDSLDYLQDLGIDAILLTPFFYSKKYHGYWTIDLEQIDPHLGSREQLQQLIRSAHQRSMRIIMDLPITHCHRDSAIADRQGWLLTDNNGERLGFFGDKNLPELDLDQAEPRQYLKKVIDLWLRLGFDGIRFDHAKRPSAAFWQDFTSHLRRHHPKVFLLGENWHDSGEIGSLAPYLHGELNIPLSQALRRFVQQPKPLALRNIFELVHEQQLQRQHGYLLPSFLDNHDMERAAQLCHGEQPVLALAYLIQFSLPYPPIIYYGSERGQRQSVHLAPECYESDRYFREPMDWRNGWELRQWVKRLIAMRKEYFDWIHQGKLRIEYFDDSMCRYSYTYKDSVIAFCLNTSAQQRNMPFPVNSTLTSLVSANPPNIKHWNLILDGFSGEVVHLKIPCSARNTRQPDSAALMTYG